VETRWLPTNFTCRRVGRSTTSKITTTPSRTRTYFGWTSMNLRVRCRVRTSSSITCESNTCPALVLSCGSFETSTVSLPSIRTSTIRSVAAVAGCPPAVAGSGCTVPVWPQPMPAGSTSSTSHTTADCRTAARPATRLSGPVSGAFRSSVQGIWWQTREGAESPTADGGKPLSTQVAERYPRAAPPTRRKVSGVSAPADVPPGDRRRQPRLDSPGCDA